MTRLKLAELTSDIGALVLGVGLGGALFSVARAGRVHCGRGSSRS
jgi:hypothetical protein